MMDFRWSRDGRTVLRDAALAAVFAVGTGVPVLAVIEPGARELAMDAAALAALYK